MELSSLLYYLREEGPELIRAVCCDRNRSPGQIALSLRRAATSDQGIPVLKALLEDSCFDDAGCRGRALFSAAFCGRGAAAGLLLRDGRFPPTARAVRTAACFGALEPFLEDPRADPEVLLTMPPGDLLRATLTPRAREALSRRGSSVAVLMDVLAGTPPEGMDPGLAALVRAAGDGCGRHALSAWPRDCAECAAWLDRALAGGGDPGAFDGAALRIAAARGNASAVARLLADPRADPAALNNWALRYAGKAEEVWMTPGRLRTAELLLGDPRVDPRVLRRKLRARPELAPALAAAEARARPAAAGPG